MTLDYTDGCVNFRDVGTFINLISNKEILPEGKIFRGGSIDYIQTLKEIESPSTIFNLRNGHDSNIFDAQYFQFPMKNKVEKYDTSQKEVRVWLNSIFATIISQEIQFPLFIHCLSGKDRTGIVVASLLLLLGIDREYIIDEYLLSDGEVKREWIEMSLDGIGKPEVYFNRFDIHKLQKYILK